MRFSLFWLFLLLTVTAFTLPPSWAQEAAQMDQHSQDDLILGRVRVAKLMIGQDLTLSGTEVQGNIAAGGDVQGTDCRVAGSLTSGDSVLLNGCASIYSITAGRNVKLHNTTVVQTVTAGRNLELVQSTIQGDATAGRNIILNQAQIEGTLTTATLHLMVDRSRLNNITITGSPSSQAGMNVIGSGNVFATNSGVVISNHGIAVRGKGGHSTISVGPGSTSAVNGFTVRATENQTTVITPDNSVYVNGTRVSGTGPEHYADYRTHTPRAPHIHGPGWIEGSTGTVKDTASTEPLQQPTHIVEVSAGSVVSGMIHFENTQGKVIVHPGARFTGSVRGGHVETR